MTTHLDYVHEEIERLDLEVTRLRQERNALRAFARKVLRGFPEGAPECFKLQEFAIEHGLLEGVEATEPCVEDGCWCAEWDDFPQTCYRRTELLTGEEG